MKTLKKLSFVLAILLALGCVAPMTAMAEVPNADTIGYSKENIVAPNTENAVDITTLADDATPTSGTYTISTADGLHKLSAIVNNGGTCAGVTFVQTADIDMATSDKTWTPIGFNASSWNSKPFNGIYDGQGHTISNMTLTLAEVPTASTSMGLLFSCGNACTIKNVVMDDTCSVSYTPAGGTREIYMGSILGRDKSAVTISNCYSAATVKNTSIHNNSTASGIIGNIFAGGTTVEYCTFAGSTQGGKRTGGIVSYIQNVNATVSHCLNVGTVKTTAQTTDITNSAAGICASPNHNTSSASTITYCENYGSISSEGTPYVGGIVGVIRAQVTVQNCTDYGEVTIPNADAPTTVYGKEYNETNAAGRVDATNKVLRDADKAMFHGYQVRANGENAVDLRLVASIDSKSYSAVGMKVTVTFTYNGTPVTKVLDNEAGSKTTTVYETLTAYANDTNVDYTADALRIDEKSGYLYAVVLTGIPKAAFDSGDFTVTVTPYATDLENAETEYMGVQAVKVITLDPLPDNTVPEN